MQLFELRGRSQHADTAFRWLTIVAAALVLVTLALVASTMTQRSLPVFEKMGLEFFTSNTFAVKGEARYHAVMKANGYNPSGLALTIGVKSYF